MKQKWICGIDLGSEKIAGAVGRIEGRTLSIFGAASVEGTGVANGVVTDLGNVSSSVKELVDRLEFQTKLRIEGTLLAVNGCHLECQSVQGGDLISERGKEITPKEVRHALQKAKSISLPMNRELLHALLQGYGVDGQEGIQNPIGMYANRLRVQLKLVTGVSTFVQNAVSCVNRAGLEVEGIIFSGYATALAVLEEGERNSGCTFLEIGESLSSLLVFQGGGVTHVKVFPVGGGLVTEKIAENFQIPLEEAESLKKQHGSLFLSERADQHELLVHDGPRKKVIRKGALCEVIREAVEGCFQDFKEETKNIPSPNGTLSLSGGASLLDGMVEMAETFFKCRARLGKVQGIRSTKPLAPPMATAVGLIRYGYEKQKEDRELLPEGPVGRVFAKVKELFLDYF